MAEVATEKAAPLPTVSVVEEKNDEINDVTSSSMKTEEKMNDTELPVEYVKVQTEGSTLIASVLNMMNTIVGAGVLSLPLTVKKSGLIGTIVVLGCSLYLSLEGAKMLSTAAVYTKAESYGMVANKLNQHGMGILGDWAMIILVLGVCVAYFIILFSQVLDLAENWLGILRATLDKYYPLIGSLIAVFIAFPLLCIPSIDSLKWISAASIVCICLFVVIAIIKGIKQVFTGGYSYYLFPQSVAGFISAVSVLLSSMCCHASIPKMTSELKLPENSRFGNKVKKMIRIDNLAFLSCGTIYLIVGIFGYLAYGDNIANNLLTNFSNDNAWYLNIVKFVYAIVVLFSFPMVGFAPLISFDKMCFKQPRPTWRRVAEAFVWTAISCFIAIIILDTVFGIMGSLCGFLVNFAIPAYFFIGVIKKERAKTQAARTPIFTASKAKYYGAWFMFYFGIVAAVIFTTIQLIDTIRTSSA